MSVRDEIGPAKTAFVFAGGGSFGAIQVGMLQSLAAHGISADMVVGSSVGALNGAFYAGDPTLGGGQRLAAIWRGLQRRDVFPITWRTVLTFLWRRDFLIPQDGIRKLIDDHIPYRNLQDAKLPVHIVTTDIISGDSIVLSEGSAPRSNISWCRHYARWWARPMISREPPTTSGARSRPLMRGWRIAACNRVTSPTRCGRTATERRRGPAIPPR